MKQTDREIKNSGNSNNGDIWLDAKTLSIKKFVDVDL